MEFSICWVSTVCLSALRTFSRGYVRTRAFKRNSKFIKCFCFESSKTEGILLKRATSPLPKTSLHELNFKLGDDVKSDFARPNQRGVNAETFKLNQHNKNRSVYVKTWEMFERLQTLAFQSINNDSFLSVGLLS